MADDSLEWKKFGRYALLQKIGSGGMAEIYRAKTFGAAGFEKEFAIKLILPSLVDDSEFVEMFINEAKLAVNLYHANIVQVFDLGEIDDQYYIAMEFVHGKDLLDVLARCAEMNIKIPLELVLFVAQEMLKGLDFAHRATDQFGEPLNIIHRDVSPSNIMISYAGDVKVGDFGVAKAAIERTLTESGTLKGKVGYMSPEQVMGDRIDARSDLFSAAIVLFEALSMNRLFVGDSDLDVMLKVRDAEYADSLEKAQPLPGDLIEILDRGLTKHREERFQTAGEFYQALVDFCFQHSIKVTGSDLSNFMRRLFAEEIEAEKKQRKSEPGGEALSRQMAEAKKFDRSNPGVGVAGESQPEKSPKTPVSKGLRDTRSVSEMDQESDGQGPGSGDEPQEGDQSSKKYRYRDDSGLVFGPMGANTLVDLLRVRNAGPQDKVSVNGGQWQPVDQVEELDLEDGKTSSNGSRRPDRQVRREVSVATQGKEPPAQPGGSGKAADTDVMRQPTPETTQKQGQQQGESAQLAGVLQRPGGDKQQENPDNQETAGPQKFGDELDERPDELDAEESPVVTEAPSVAEDYNPADTIRELKEQYASYEGELSAVSIGRILGRLHLAEETGRLLVTRDDVEKSIFFRQGEPIFVQSNRREELLGRFLRSKDVISEEQLDEALERLGEWGGRLGDALVAIKAIPAHELFEHLTAQMREKLLEVFTWDGGYYSYFENQEPEEQAYSLGLDTYETVVEGCRQRVSLDRIRREYQNRMFVSIYINDPSPLPPDRLGLRTVESRVVNTMESGTTLEKLLDQFDQDDHETVYRTVYLLHQVEIVSFEVTGRVDLPPLPDP